MSSEQKTEDTHGEHKLGVAVVTTSGAYPEEGYAQVPSKQKMSVMLGKAAEQLRLTDTSNWIAKVGGRTVDPHKTYEENGLTGKIDIDWGPREGGGGQR